MHAFDRRTDGRTDRQTEISSQDRVCIPCSAVKTNSFSRWRPTWPFGWYSLRRLTKGWPGRVDLGGWSHTEISDPHRILNPDTVTHPSTNRARRMLTSLIETTNALPLRQSTTHGAGKQTVTRAVVGQFLIRNVFTCRLHWMPDVCTLTFS